MTEINAQLTPKTQIFTKKNGVYVITLISNCEDLSMNAIKNIFNRTIQDRIKNCVRIIDFVENKKATRELVVDLTPDEKNNNESMIKTVIEKINSFNIDLKRDNILSFARYQEKFTYIDNILLVNESKYWLLTGIYLTQFVEFEETPDYNTSLKFHNRFTYNLRKRRGMELEAIKFSVLYGKSNAIGFFCILAGCIVCILSILNILAFPNIIFGIIAIIVGIIWFFPIK